MKRALLVRGDLRSHFGMAHMLRALLAVIEPLFDDIVGVDLHHHPKFETHPFPYPIITDKEGQCRIFEEKHIQWTVLHHTTPNLFYRFKEAVNIGYFLWETDRPPKGTSWRQDFQSLDALWVAAPYLADLAFKLGWKKDILTVPWPMFVPEPRSQTSLPDTIFHRVNHNKITRTKSSQIKHELDGHYLSISSDAPRKALPILLSEWIRYKRKSRRSFALILKLSTFNTEKTEKNLLEECRQTVELASAPNLQKNIDLYVLARSMKDLEINRLHTSARVLLSATLGEGFGGPVAEAALNAKPVLAPRHSSLEQLIPADYPLSLEFENFTLSQGPNAPYSISSKWGLVRPNSIRDALLQLDDLLEQDLEKIGLELQSHVARVCSPDSILAKISRFYENRLPKERS
jgi:hypothetical protein